MRYARDSDSVLGTRKYEVLSVPHYAGDHYFIMLGESAVGPLIWRTRNRKMIARSVNWTKLSLLNLARNVETRAEADLIRRIDGPMSIANSDVARSEASPMVGPADLGARNRRNAPAELLGVSLLCGSKVAELAFVAVQRSSSRIARRHRHTGLLPVP